MKIKFKDNFVPDRIYATDSQLTELGMVVTGGRDHTSVMWTHEPPFKLTTPAREYEVSYDGFDLFFSNGVIFGYVEEDDYTEVE